jgi:hypothetical protein
VFRHIQFPVPQILLLFISFAAFLKLEKERENCQGNKEKQVPPLRISGRLYHDTKGRAISANRPACIFNTPFISLTSANSPPLHP